MLCGSTILSPLFQPLVIDQRDEKLAPAVADAGLTPIVTNTIMESLEDKTTLASEILALLK